MDRHVFGVAQIDRVSQPSPHQHRPKAISKIACELPAVSHLERQLSAKTRLRAGLAVFGRQPRVMLSVTFDMSICLPPRHADMPYP